MRMIILKVTCSGKDAQAKQENTINHSHVNELLLYHANLLCENILLEIMISKLILFQIDEILCSSELKMVDIENGIRY